MSKKVLISSRMVPSISKLSEVLYCHLVPSISCSLEVTVRDTAPEPVCRNVLVPVCCVHVLVAVHRYLFCPGAASVAKYSAPCVQVAGNSAVVPRLATHLPVRSEEHTSELQSL